METLRILFGIRYTYAVNTTLHRFRQLPLIGKHIPYSLYDNRDIKALFSLLSNISYVIRTVFRKCFYFGMMVFLPAFLSSRLTLSELVQQAKMSGDNPDMVYEYLFQAIGHPTAAMQALGTANYMHILFFTFLIGALMNQSFLSSTVERYYSVILMRMDAKRYTLADYGLFLAETAAGYLIVGTLFGCLLRVPVWMGLLACCGMLDSKLIMIACTLKRYPKTDRLSVGSLHTEMLLVLILVLFAAAYIPPVLHMAVPYPVLAVLCAVLTAGGVCSLQVLLHYPDYRELCQKLSWDVLHPEMENLTVESSRNLISEDTGLTSERSGFEYLNELFVKRHKKLLWRRSRIITAISAAAAAVAILFCLLSEGGGAGINKFLLTHFPLLLIFMYWSNAGANYTQALFVNCDHSLLTYSIFKQPEAILKLFWIRLREILKVNLLPATVIGGSLAFLLYLGGGTDNPLYYGALLFGTIAMAVFFSVHYLTLYYLLQPYTIGSEMKSPLYGAITTATYVVCYMMDQFEMDTLVFGAVIIGLCLLYCIAAGVLVYLLAPKTFRIRES